MSFINTNTDKYQKWRYIVSEFSILYADGSTVDIPSHRVQSISIVNAYETNLFPIFKIELVLASLTYYKILKNKKDVKFKIRIQKYNTAIDNSVKSLYRDWINDTFDLILDDDDYNADESILKEEKELDYDTTINTDYENDVSKVDNLIEFFLFKSDLVDQLNVNVNAILSNATVNDGIQYIATQAGLTNLLMSSPANATTYNELVIPPLKAKHAIRFLDTYYGLYKPGMLFYCDMIRNITYILEYNHKCTAYQNKELIETNIIIPKKSSKYTSELCSLYRRDNEETYFIIGSNQQISIRNETVSYNAYSATDVTIIDTYSGDISKSDSTANIKNQKSTKIIENNTENPWLPHIYRSIIGGKNLVVEMALGDYDIDAIAPNKAFKIVFEDPSLASKCKGGFVISEATHTFLKEGESFTLTSLVKFKQV